MSAQNQDKKLKQKKIWHHRAFKLIDVLVISLIYSLSYSLLWQIFIEFLLCAKHLHVIQIYKWKHITLTSRMSHFKRETEANKDDSSGYDEIRPKYNGSMCVQRRKGKLCMKNVALWASTNKQTDVESVPCKKQLQVQQYADREMFGETRSGSILLECKVLSGKGGWRYEAGGSGGWTGSWSWKALSSKTLQVLYEGNQKSLHNFSNRGRNHIFTLEMSLQ